MIARRSVVSLMLLSACLPARTSMAGECLCDQGLYFDVLAEKAPPEAIAECTCCGDEAGTLESALRCMYSFSYDYMHNDASEKRAARLDQSWKRGLDALLHVWKAHDELQSEVVKVLLESKSYLDRDYRARIGRVMKRSGKGELWQILVGAAEGDAAMKRRALYRFCSDYQVVVELLDGPKAWTQLWPPPAGVKSQAAWKKLSCPYMQEQLVALGLDEITGAVSEDFLHLLTKASLGILRNGVFARRGRAFESEALRAFFAGKAWYAVDPAYSDAKLTDIDKANIDLIRREEKAR